MKVFVIVLLVLCGIFLTGCFSNIFITSVGDTPDKNDRKNYAMRASNFDGKVFSNEKAVSVMNKTEDEDPLRLSKNETTPSAPLIEKTPSFLQEPALSDFTVTWFGHSTLLFQLSGMNILFDPVFSERISPVSWAGPKKFAVKNFDMNSLPEIDVLVLSHDHYDHLDYQAIKKLDSKVKKYIVPLGVECHLRRWKIDQKKVTNMAWWEEVEVNGLKITATPSQHFSGRWVTGRNTSLWNSYVLKNDWYTIFESGDTGYSDHFKRIHEKFGDFDAAFMECGQYNVRWPQIHSFPEQTAQAAKDLGAAYTMPIHWGSIVLSTNGWDDSILRFSKKAEELKLKTITPYLCQTVNFADIKKAASDTADVTGAALWWQNQ